VSLSDTCIIWRDSFAIISCTIHSSGDTLIHIITSHIHTHSHTHARAHTYTHTHTHTHHYLYIINSSTSNIILNLE